MSHSSWARRALIVAIGAGVFGSASVMAAGRPDLVRAGLEAGKPHLSGELLVQFLPGVDARMQSAALAAIGAERLRTVVSSERRSDRKGDLLLVRFPSSFAIDTALRVLEGNRNVDFAEPNWTYRHDAVSNDPYFTNGSLWGMYGDASTPSNVYGSQAAEAWAAGHTCDSDTIIGVTDEGVMNTHEDLAANIWTNPYDPVDGADNDGNGYVDDTHGWDFVSDDNTTFDGTNDDHGTHVSGTIAGVGGNGKGVAGVCWTAKIINAKFLGKVRGSTADAISATDYLTDLKTRHGLHLMAINNSWGGGGYSQGLYDAVDRAGDADILFIAAAGNDGVDGDTSPHYPSSYDNANLISVASISSNGTLSSFSNYGATSVDLGAPGASIYSTVPTGSRRSVSSGYASYSGTSMATPHVTGAVALYASTHPSATALQIRSAILGSVVATPSLNGKTVTGGRLNVSGY
jgi:subtilisin family serine protease